MRGPQPNVTGVLIRGGDQGTHTHRDDHVGTRGEDGRLHAQERGLRGNQPCDTYLQNCETGNVCCLGLPICGACYAGPGDQHTELLLRAAPLTAARTVGSALNTASHTRPARLLCVGGGEPEMRIQVRLTVFRRKHTENKMREHTRLNREEGKSPQERGAKQGLCEHPTAGGQQTLQPSLHQRASREASCSEL